MPGLRGAPQRRETQRGHIPTCPGPQEINKSMSQEVRSGVAHAGTDDASPGGGLAAGDSVPGDP